MAFMSGLEAIVPDVTSAVLNKFSFWNTEREI